MRLDWLLFLRNGLFGICCCETRSLEGRRIAGCLVSPSFQGEQFSPTSPLLSEQQQQQQHNSSIHTPHNKLVLFESLLVIGRAFLRYVLSIFFALLVLLCAILLLLWGGRCACPRQSVSHLERVSCYAYILRNSFLSFRFSHILSISDYTLCLSLPRPFSYLFSSSEYCYS
ncbi:hypothetical protein GQ43DRAFT_181472 [Delitschia confertaspora ATCC 74209]|uniref:Uncharacterized protein n=1 Tax=Delitschia confertaspora ATCC 74209 TaxID=1513339 RepID=A0A9P4JJS0_9PLEO|nr:hypothetical protein GQ43DRAFT_181472 [Delitschia confertaspora ATCC 74209]